MGEGHSQPTVIVDEIMPPDPQIVAVLNRAIRDRTVIEIKYFTTSRRELGERLVEPYLLFHSPDGWYLEAYCRKAAAQRTFKLERICEARPTTETFTPRAEMDLRRRRTGADRPGRQRGRLGDHRLPPSLAHLPRRARHQVHAARRRLGGSSRALSGRTLDSPRGSPLSWGRRARVPGLSPRQDQRDGRRPGRPLRARTAHAGTDATRR